MKKLVAMLSLGVLVSGASFAQTTPQQNQEHKPRKEHRIGKKDKAHLSPEERATKRTERMALKLDLNKSQKKKLQALNLKQAQEREALRASRGSANGIENRSQLREQGKARHAAYEAELKDILNKKQYAQYETMRAEVRAKHEQKRELRKERRSEKQEQRG